MMTTKRLLDFANCSGCAGKLAPMNVASILRDLPARSTDPNLLLGTETSDDAGGYLRPPPTDPTPLVGREPPDAPGLFLRPEGSPLSHTPVFSPPLVAAPFTFGQIAATNALSDVSARNARPPPAMNIVGFPDTELPM